MSRVADAYFLGESCEQHFGCSANGGSCEVNGVRSSQTGRQTDKRDERGSVRNVRG